MRRTIGVLSLGLVLGCYTFRAATTIDAETLEAVPRSPQAIVLVIDDDYRGFKSRDRGHAAADPQTYEIGAALAKLTEDYFRRAFSSVQVVSQLGADAGGGGADFVVHPAVNNFDNDLSLGGGTQTLTLDLMATVATADGATLGTAHGHGTSKHQIQLLREDEARVGRYLGLIIQQALASLVTEVAGTIGRRSDEPRAS